MESAADRCAVLVRHVAGIQSYLSSVGLSSVGLGSVGLSSVGQSSVGSDPVVPK